MKSFGCMPAVRTPEASRTLTMPHPEILPSPLRDKIGVFDHDRFRGYISVHFRSGLHPPCLRFAVAVAGHHARLGTRLLVRLCRGRHFRQLNSMRFQGATLAERCVSLSTHTAPIKQTRRPYQVSSVQRVASISGKPSVIRFPPETCFCGTACTSSSSRRPAIC
jgi:hypothetical protein